MFVAQQKCPHPAAQGWPTNLCPALCVGLCAAAVSATLLSTLVIEWLSACDDKSLRLLDWLVASGVGSSGPGLRRIDERPRLSLVGMEVGRSTMGCCK